MHSTYRSEKLVSRTIEAYLFGWRVVLICMRDREKYCWLASLWLVCSEMKTLVAEQVETLFADFEKVISCHLEQEPIPRWGIAATAKDTRASSRATINEILTPFSKDQQGILLLLYTWAKMEWIYLRLWFNELNMKSNKDILETVCLIEYGPLLDEYRN